MDKATRTKLLDKKMTRREFLQFAGSSFLVLFGLSNIIALINHTKQTVESPAGIEVAKASNGFGSRKFGA
jgi:hypothetical protein